MNKIISGKVWIFGDNINTDDIVPSRVLTEQNKEKLLQATFELIEPNFAKNVQKGDIIVAGRNFGSGSSREEAVFVLKELGISAIIAESFSRIYFRNAINLGLPAIVPKNEIPYTKIAEQGHQIIIDFEKGTMKNTFNNIEYKFKPFPEFIANILDSGGMIPYLLKSKNK